MHRVIATAFVLASLLIARETLGQTRTTTAISDDVRTLISVGKADSALAVARRAVTEDSTDVSLLFALADAQKAKRHMRARRETLERILRTQPRSIDARVEIAEDFFEVKQLDSAAYSAYSALAKSNRRSVDAYYWLGRIHHQAGRPDSALFYYRGAWVLLPDGDLF